MSRNFAEGWILRWLTKLTGKFKKAQCWGCRLFFSAKFIVMIRNKKQTRNLRTHNLAGKGVASWKLWLRRVGLLHRVVRYQEPRWGRLPSWQSICHAGLSWFRTPGLKARCLPGKAAGEEQSHPRKAATWASQARAGVSCADCQRGCMPGAPGAGHPAIGFNICPAGSGSCLLFRSFLLGWECSLCNNVYW